VYNSPLEISKPLQPRGFVHPNTRGQVKGPFAQHTTIYLERKPVVFAIPDQQAT